MIRILHSRFVVLPSAILLLAASAGMARAADPAGAKELRSACPSELTKYCPSTTVAVYEQTACLHNYYVDLSIVCRNALKRRAAANAGTSGSASQGTGLSTP